MFHAGCLRKVTVQTSLLGDPSPTAFLIKFLDTKVQLDKALAGVEAKASVLFGRLRSSSLHHLAMYADEGF